MSRSKLLLQSLRYYWRTHLAVLLGVVAGTAVLAGALIVGDSVRGSLREMTLVRLGNIDHVLSGPRFVREELAADLAALPEFAERFSNIAPAIVLPSTLEKPSPDGTATLARAGQVNLYGVDDRLWKLVAPSGSSPPRGDALLLSAAVARQLNVAAGDSVILSVELPSDIPRDSLLGKRDQSAVQFPVEVQGILPETSGVGRLGLHPDQQLPRNAFVALGTLQDRLGLAARRAPGRASRRDAPLLPARVNALFASARNSADGSGPQAPSAALALNTLLPRAWQLEDFHLRIASHADPGYVSLESERMILDQTVARRAEEVAADLGAKRSGVLVYIANELKLVARGDGGDLPPADEKPLPYSRYTIVAGIEPSLLTSPEATPFGPYVLAEGALVPPLGDGQIAQPDGEGQIVLNDWVAADLRARVGDTLSLTYHMVGSHGDLPEVERRFVIRGVLTLEGTPAADRGLTPEVRGITDVNSFTDWDAPFPMLPVTPRDDDYWKRYRATPKGFVTLSAAQHLWQNRYGDLTSFRVAAAPGKTLEATATGLSRELLSRMTPQELGLAFQPTKFQGLRSASGTTDFGGLFIGFSFFLILSAAILIGLLFRLGIERRAAQMGLLRATGFSTAQVRRLFLMETLMVVLAGVALGLLAAIAYAALMIHGLTTWWIGAIGTRFLELHLVPGSLATGAAIAILVALGAVWWGVRGLDQIAERSLLAGVTQPPLAELARSGRRGRARRVTLVLAGIALTMTLAVISGVVPATEAFAGFSWPTIIFFLVGLTVLAAGLAWLSAWIDADRALAVRGRGAVGLARLALRNGARHRSRSLLSAGLVASATFLIVAIAAGHRNPAAEQPDLRSGNGGFTLVAESPAPVLFDLNSATGRERLGLGDEASAKVLDDAGKIIGFRMNPGENASCLNIYQTAQPTILGVPAEMVARGGFKFVGTAEPNPWRLLEQEEPDGPIPVLGDMNTLQYSLHVGLGQTLEIRDEQQRAVKVRIVGMLDGSIFQGVLLMGEGPFRQLFPSRVGARYFLIEASGTRAREVGELLEAKLPGFDAERVADRLASFLAVQNTYLSTFQALGGLGLLLGTIGLATVMLRNVLERRSELALLRAVGFRHASLGWLVLCENALILAWGLACGALSAMLAMLPHLLSTGADIPWRDVATIVAAVFAVGMSASLAAVRSAVQTPVLATLRGE
ncbi:MAG: ABC transporter permease [Planctomycetales bacterium]